MYVLWHFNPLYMLDITVPNDFFFLINELELVHETYTTLSKQLLLWQRTVKGKVEIPPKLQENKDLLFKVQLPLPKHRC